MGFKASIQSIPNPRKEAEEHYYNPRYSGLLELGLQPTYLTDELVSNMLEKINEFKDHIDIQKIMPRVRWAA